MKFLKRLFQLLLVAVLAVVLLAAVGFVRSRQQPEWYAHVRAFDPAQAAEAARRAQDKLASSQSWAAAGTAAELRARSGVKSAASAPSPRHTLTFTEEELNAFFNKMALVEGWNAIYDPYLSNPALILNDGKLIVAGTVKELDRVVSFHFRPSIEKKNGRLRLELESVMAGRLPMPQALFDSYRQRLAQRVQQMLPQYKAAAALRGDGSVNEEAVRAATGQLLLSVINRRSAEPVLFLKGNGYRDVPVRVVDCAIDGSTVTLAVEMMTPAERQAWMQRLRGSGEAPPAPAE
jgi:hypothetical protein